MAERQPEASSQFQWLLLKNWNSFYRKGLNNSRFSAEPGNLYNKHSYKYSGGVPCQVSRVLFEYSTVCTCLTVSC